MGVGTWAGRVWVPAALAGDGVAGPRVVTLRAGEVWDVSHEFATFADLVNASDPVGSLRAAGGRGISLGFLSDIFADSIFTRRAPRTLDETRIVLLAPNDILATKACGVTFIRSLLERVIEEKAKGDPRAATVIRQTILDVLGDDLSKVEPGSLETAALKARLIEQGAWSQYLEVGIGPDAEIFTKCQPMASVGFGAQIGVLPASKWNNPEPEIVLAVSNRGAIVGATLGNDVNLRDYEGRSALLLGEAKDQNGSCAIGPMVRLFDETFDLANVRSCEVALSIVGEDGFTTHGSNRMSEISRDPANLVGQAIGRHHQYPDGFMLFLGTMFAPTDDRERPGEGFTHHPGDRVEISSPELGMLVNWVNHTDAIPPWDYGLTELIAYLTTRKKNS
jgi:fumarylacetoacetate (FAA) hydrolase family protein